MPAVVTMSRTAWGNWGKAFADRLKQAGKPSLVIITAVMRERVAIAYGVLKSGQPLDPALHAA